MAGECLGLARVSFRDRQPGQLPRAQGHESSTRVSGNHLAREMGPY